MIANTHYGYAGKSKMPKFTYTGNYNVRDDGVVELLTSGTLVFLDPGVIDVFCVGGGGAGAQCYSYTTIKAGGGGGGGYTATAKKQRVSGEYIITIGNGAHYPTATRGETTSFGNLVSAEGGYSGGALSSQTTEEIGNGCNGGSGGGGGTNSSRDGGTGGSDGNDGERGGNVGGLGGKGKGSTTREFGDGSGKLYSGGGGGGRYFRGAQVLSMGGAGGGGNGCWLNGTGTFVRSTAGVENTGGGGGGGAATNTYAIPGASGGSGIVCFRAAK